MQMLSAGST